MKQDERSTILSSIMDAVGFGSPKRIAPSGVRYLGMGGAFGKARIRHCSTWDFGYKLPRPASRNQFSDIDNR